jgi:hypothetical protein
MTSHEMTLTFDQFALSSKSAVEDRAFRIVLLSGELLRVPKAHRSIRVVSGAAWISHNGHDYELNPGEVLPLARTRHDALVSAEGQTLFLEIA